MTHRNCIKSIGCFWIVLWVSSTLMAQQPTKIGLTLSGGGAKGLAHIGILKAMDSAGLRVDVITGTSMGSIVGGLYAAGYTADSIEALARAIDWKLLLSNSISMRSYIMEEKSEYGRYAVEFPIDKGKITLPTGFLESQELWLKLEELFYPVAAVKDFDQLYIPFRCIATDLRTGKAHAFKSGDLVAALRGSMAIPGVFSPVNIDSSRYVDGGVVRNFPVKDVIDMGANFTIGVSVSQPLRDVQALDNAVKVLTQVVFLGENKDRLEESKLCNLLIDMPMENYSSASFNKAQEIIDLGISEGRKYYPLFKHLADSLQAINRKKIQLRSTYFIQQVSVSGLKPAGAKVLVQQLDIQKGKPYSATQITSVLRNAFAFRRYKNLTYMLHPLGDTGYEMQVKAVPESATTLKAGLNFNSLTGFSVVGNLTLRNWLSPFSRTLFSINFGENFRFLAEHLQMFGERSAWSNRIEWYVENQEIPYYQDLKRLGQYGLQYYRLDNQILNSARRRWSAGMGIRFEHIKAVPKILQGSYIAGKNSYFYPYGLLSYNSFDRPNFPSKGFKMEVQGGWIFGQMPNVKLYQDGVLQGDINPTGGGYKNYPRLSTNIERVMPISAKWSGIMRLQGGANFGSYQSLLNFFVAGGNSIVTRNQIVFAGLREGEVLSESMVAMRFGGRWRMLTDLYVTFNADALSYDFIAKRDESSNGTKYKLGAGITVGYNLPIGPFELTTMYTGNVGGIRTYVNFGFPFKRD